MAEYSTDQYRGLLIRDRGFDLSNIDAAETTATQAGPEPDRPTPDTTSYMYHEATGDISGTATTETIGLQIATAKPGAALLGNGGGRFIWRTDEAGKTGNDNYRGWWPHTTINNHRWIKYIGPDGDDLGPGACHPRAVYLPNGRS